MLKTLFFVTVLIFAVLWLPFWAQAGLFLIFVIFIPYKFFLVLPALFSDFVYSPDKNLTFGHFKFTFLIISLALLWWFISTKTRLAEKHVFQKK